MSLKRKILFATLFIGILFFLFLWWYKNEYSMDRVEPFQVNSQQLDQKIAIATQGSKFKNKITKTIIDHYEKDSIFINVIDVSSLYEIDPKDYDAIVLIHTWENWKPPAEVQLFIDRTKGYKERIIVVTTSGEGTAKMEDIDAITGESILKNATLLADNVIIRLKALLKTKDYESE